MAIRPKRPVRIIGVLTTVAANYYTAEERLILTDLILVNSTANAVAVTLGFVPQGGSLALANELMNAKLIDPQTPYFLTQQSIPIEFQEQLMAFAATANAITLWAIFTDKEGQAYR